MKRQIMPVLCICIATLLAACRTEDIPIVETTLPPATVEVVAETVPETTLPPETEPQPTQPEHSEFYIPGVSVEDVIRYFEEVCLDAEFTYSGDASLIQKWMTPIYYTLNGTYTDEDISVLNGFVQWLNRVEGFPGMYQTEERHLSNLQIYFCDHEEMVSRMGEEFTGMDASVVFWYEMNEIYDATICYRTDLDQQLRNSVILEEIYNGLGPIQDTSLRPDSIIYAEFSQPQALTAMDELILRLLYHPQMVCGMNVGDCEAVIRQLYY
ncbi:MAG: DUF2927 domain-containing protein [Oscillospiraceae bacterium]|nr:DUF2927 domain-containing protein [Oscillospiraceae bacterium]